MEEEYEGNTPSVLIVTHSRSGFTDNMADAIAEGVETSGVEAVIKRVTEIEPTDLEEADAIAFGSPIYLNYISGDLKHFLDDVFFKFRKVERVNKLKGKPAVAFVSGRYKGYDLKRLQFTSVPLKDLECILFSRLKLRNVVEGLHLIHDVSPRDPRAPLSLTHKQTILCRNIGKTMASSIRTSNRHI